MIFLGQSSVFFCLFNSVCIYAEGVRTNEIAAFEIGMIAVRKVPFVASSKELNSTL